MKKIIVTSCFGYLFLGLNIGWGQFNISTTIGSLSENFNTLINSGSVTWNDNSTIANWYAQRTGTGSNISANDGSSNTGNLYSYGTGTSTDRALGSVGSGGASAGSFAWGVKLRNTTTSTLEISLAYTGEQWRNSGATSQTVGFYFRKNSSDFSNLDPNNNSSWTNVSSLNFTSPITGGTAGALDGNLAANKVFFSNTIVTTLAPNEYIILKWDDPDHSGSDHGMSIDDVTISWAPPISGPEINVKGNSINIASGDMTPSLADHTDFGGVNVTSGTQTRTFTIENLGTTDLNIASITITGAHASDFTILSLPSSTISSASSSTLVIQFDPSAVGLRTAQVNIPSNDSDENPYVFAIQGLGSNATFFRPGDLMFVGFDNQISGATDRISIVSLVDITPGTTFTYANAVYEMFAAANTRTQRWYGCNADADNNIEAWDITYNGTSTIAAGSIICFEVPSSGGPVNFSINGISSSDFSKAASPNVTGGSANMSTGAPDAVFLMQGTFTNHVTYSTFSGTILGGIMQGGLWYTIADDLSSIPSGNGRRRSRIPPEIECFAVQATTTIGLSVAYYTGSKASNPQFTHINNIINFTTNWHSSTGTTGDDIPASGCNTSFVVSGAAAVAGKWTGSDNTNWFNCRNWENFSVPTATVDVTISPTASNNPTISSTATNADLFFASLDGTQRVAECRNLNLDRLTLVIEASNSNRLDIHGNFTISGTGALDMDDSNPASSDGVINLLGNWNNSLGTAGSFLEGNGSVHFRGGLNQTITTQGGIEGFYNIVFNKTGGNVTLNSTNAEISGSATFTAGRVNAPNATTARMEFLDNATTTGANNNSYVNGWVRKVGNDAFVFPVGDDGFYAPIAISAPANTTDHFTATYDRVYPTPYSILSKDPTLDHVGNCEHWILNRTGGSSNVFVELSYDNVRSCGITTGQESALRVARWDGAVWRDHGNTTATLIPTNAIRSGAAISSFSPFTLASANSFNPLPLELLTFKGKINHKGEAELTWQTASELNIAGFEVEKSTDNREFRKIGFVNAKNANLNAYSFIDKDFAGLSYYRLRVVETNKTFRYSQTISLDKTKAVQLLIYPNPASEKDFVKVALGARNEINSISIQILSQTGKILAEVVGNLETTETQLTEKLQNLPKGLYIIRLQTENGEMLTAKFVKQ